MRDASIFHIPMKGSRMAFRRLLVVAAAMLAAASACTESTAPDSDTERAATDLRLLAAPHTAPPLATTTASFYAVKGKDGGVDIWYRPAAGHSDSSKYLEFRVGSNSLDRRPDGTAIANGDSVLISLTVTDPTHFIIEFQPSGLKFSDGDQPKLKISFAACGDDLNYDGKVDDTDSSMLSSLALWRQEAPFQPWFKLSSTVSASVKEVNATLTGFTGYALMY
ncbi:MAG: hypothetical protein ACJ8B6_00205 [Gemmatimonadales bacterium]